MQKGQQYGFIESDFLAYFEPDEGINNEREFTDEILKWAKKENRDVTILKEGMEPEISLDGKKCLCMLGDVGAASANNPISKALHIRGANRIIGPYLGYKWVYVYEMK